MYKVTDYKLIDIENSLVDWLNISFIITTLTPIFFGMRKHITENKKFLLILIFLMSLSCLIIIIAFIPFFYRHRLVISSINLKFDETKIEHKYKKIEKGIFIAQCIFCIGYFILAIIILLHMIISYIKY